MSQRELTRLEVIQRVKRKTLKQRQAAELLSVSVRQVKRLCNAYQASGAAGLISKRRGQPSNNRLPEKTINKAQQLLRSRYSDFGPTLATEKLTIEGVSLSVETVRQLLIGEGLWKAKAVRRPVIHQLRERRARVGELVQIDGSPHDWFEGRAPKCTLLVFVDDATSRLRYLQDRLTKELRLRSISSLVAANAYLPEFIAAYNERFAVAPRSEESAHRALAKGEDLERVLTLCERRTLSKNLTLSYNNVIYQIKSKRAAYTMRGAHVEVRETRHGEITIEYKKRSLDYTIYCEKEQQQGKVIEAKQKRGLVPMSHPWRLFDFTENSMLARERRGELCILRK